MLEVDWVWIKSGLILGKCNLQDEWIRSSLITLIQEKKFPNVVYNFRLLTDIWLSAVQYTSVFFILIDRYKFLSPATLKRYINILEYEDEQFSTKQQALEFYVIYIETISKQRSLFTDKVKEQGSLKTAKYTEDNLHVLAKLFYNYKA